MIFEESNMFGDIEFIHKINQLRYSVICLSQTAEVFYIKYDDLSRIINSDMREIMQNEVNSKSTLLQDKFNYDVSIYIKKVKAKEIIPEGQLLHSCTRHDFTLNSNKHSNSKSKRKSKAKTHPHHREKLMPLIVTKSSSMTLMFNKTTIKPIKIDYNKPFINTNNLISIDKDSNNDNRNGNNNNDNNDYLSDSERNKNRLKISKCLSDSNIVLKSMRHPTSKISLPHLRNYPLRNDLSNCDKRDKTNFLSTNCFSETVRNNKDIMKEQKNQYLRTGIKLPLQKVELKNKVFFNFFKSSMKTLLLEVNPRSVDYVG